MPPEAEVPAEVADLESSQYQVPAMLNYHQGTFHWQQTGERIEMDPRYRKGTEITSIKNASSASTRNRVLEKDTCSFEWEVHRRNSCQYPNPTHHPETISTFSAHPLNCSSSLRDPTGPHRLPVHVLKMNNETDLSGIPASFLLRATLRTRPTMSSPLGPQKRTREWTTGDPSSVHFNQSEFELPSA